MRVILGFILSLFLSLPVLGQTATSITFPDDEIRTMVAGKVPEGTTQVFTVEGGSGAPLGLYLMSADKNAAFEVIGPDGALFATSSADQFEAQKWKGTLAGGGVYTITVYSLGGLADFQLTVEMP